MEISYGLTATGVDQTAGSQSGTYGCASANVPVAFSKVPPSKRLILAGRTFDLRGAYKSSGVVAGHQ